MIRCRIYNCQHHMCCADCGERGCERRCLNTPDRCRCSVTGPLPEEARRLPLSWPKDKPKTPAPPEKRTRKPMPHKVDWNEVARLRSCGYTLSRIAAEVGTTPAYVSNILRKLKRQGGDANG